MSNGQGRAQLEPVRVRHGKVEQGRSAATTRVTAHESKQGMSDTLTCGYRDVPRHVSENRQRPVTLIGGYAKGACDG